MPRDCSFVDVTQIEHLDLDKNVKILFGTVSFGMKTAKT